MSDHRPVRIALIGCGDIARKAYVPNCRRFPILDLVACADLDAARAQAFAKELNIPRSGTVEEILADPSIELVVNLTVPQAHAAVDLAALTAGKHVYSEKPFAISRAEGQAVVDLARQRGLRVGCAPDTVLGCGVQTARQHLDAGVIGRVVGGTCTMVCGGHESWHPSPDFYYAAGGGPLFDMGPYYLHALITLLGPVTRVAGMSSAAHAQRTIGSGPRRGQVIPVDVPTHLTALLAFAGGSQVTMTMSFDGGGGTSLPNIELLGTEGSMQVPDPNGTNGPVMVRRRGLHGWTEYQRTHPYREGARGVGVADLAMAIRTGRPHRADDAVAMHALDVMVAVHEAATAGRTLDVASTCPRPAAMRADLPEGTLDG